MISPASQEEIEEVSESTTWLDPHTRIPRMLLELIPEDYHREELEVEVM